MESLVPKITTKKRSNTNCGSTYILWYIQVSSRLPVNNIYVIPIYFSSLAMDVFLFAAMSVQNLNDVID